MMNRERTRSFTLGPRVLLYECTDHESFDMLCEIVNPALQALLDVAAPAGLNDVTLKYVDEVRHLSAAELHEPIHRAFESAITDRMRDHFRGNNGD
jgi:hypothetical protein